MLSIFLLILMIFSWLLLMSFFTLTEQKFLSYFHTRKGPNKVGKLGLFQPFSDALKLLTKIPSNHLTLPNLLFWIIPSFSLLLSMVLLLILPNFYLFTPNSNLMFLLFIIISSLSVYPIMFMGWISNSKYSQIGTIRNMAQSISYEISMFFIMISPLTTTSSSSSTMMMEKNILSEIMIFMSIFWLMIILAESNRTPFDMSEGESELVSGFNTEYSSMSFIFIFMSEYLMILILSMITSILFFPMFFMKMFFLLISLLYILIRATMPRMRFDFLMNLNWYLILPLNLSLLLTIFFL